MTKLPSGNFRLKHRGLFRDSAGISFKSANREGARGDEIQPGDLVTFGLAQLPPLAPISWAKHGFSSSDSSVRIIFFEDTNQPTDDDHLFEVLRPSEFGDFEFPELVEVPFRGSTRVTGAVLMPGTTGSTLPGGMPFVLTVSDLEFLVPMNLTPANLPGEFTGALPEGAHSVAVELGVRPHLGALGPTDSRPLRLTVRSQATQRPFPRSSLLRAVQTPFISLNIDSVVQAGSGCLPLGVIPFWRPRIDLVVSATLRLEHPGALPSDQFPLRVALASDPSIEGLLALPSQLAMDRPIPLVFSVRPSVQGESQAIIESHWQTLSATQTGRVRFVLHVTAGGVEIQPP